MISLIRHPKASCYYHRIELPFQYLGIRTREAIDKDTSLVVVNRLPHDTNPAFRLKKKQFGFKLWVDIDDYWILPPEHPLYQAYRVHDYSRRMAEMIQMADVVTCTNSRLASFIKEHNKNVHVIPNGLPFDDGQFTITNWNKEGVKYVYAGGHSHIEDVKLLGKPDYDFTLAGFNSSRDQSVDMWRALGKPKVIQELPLNRYMECYNGMNVSLVPITKTIFNSCKSNLKILEAGAKGIACICSDEAPYSSEKLPGALYRSNFKGCEPLKYSYSNRLAKDWAEMLSETVRAFYDLRNINAIRHQLIKTLI